ncbi:MAG: hypothetical protein HKN72_11240 [Gemmatimonadetes bacterium]|nr:hypothetical protein [Gemmatimonadota bacterium]NNF13792.1 hypothetical protein [Gemmatimonadota bacterium]
MKRVVMTVATGSIALFVLGFVMYVVLLGGFYEAYLGSATGVMRDVPIGWAMIISQVGLASMLAFVLHLSDASSALDGLRVGGTFGLLFGVAVAFDLYAVTNWSTLPVPFVEPLVTATRLALASAAMGWVVGRGSDAPNPVGAT